MGQAPVDPVDPAQEDVYPVATSSNIRLKTAWVNAVVKVWGGASTVRYRGRQELGLPFLKADS
jgi:hypothetical protein